MPDTALDTFKTALNRGRYLLKLYHGLANTRQRSIRSDWASGFRSLMHWPQSSTIDRVDSNDVVIVLKDASQLSSTDFAHDQLTDLLRASLVMGVSALDAYFHCKVLAFVVKLARNGDGMPKALAKATMTVADFVGARRYKRRMHAVRNALQRNLGFQSLQQPKNVEDSLALIGVSSFWNSVAKRVGQPADDLKKKLLKIVKRRNLIAHEGDLSQSRKARNKPHALLPGQVKSFLDFLDVLVNAAEGEINHQLGI
jgi:hypothetical protein